MKLKNDISEKIFSMLCTDKVTEWNFSKDISDVNIQLEIKKQEKEWMIFWKKLKMKQPDFKNKICIDYGCGYGFDSLLMLKLGAKHVYCLDIEDDRLSFSKNLHEMHNFKNATYIKNLNPNDLANQMNNQKVDIIICRDVMEHVNSPYKVIKSMYDSLKKGGEVFIGFSPLYNSPYGPHISSKCKVPWVHHVFDEKVMIEVFKKKYNLSESIKGFGEIPGSGVNKLSYYNYMKILNNFKWSNLKSIKNSYPEKKIIELFLLLIDLIPFKKFKELFIISSYSYMVK